METRANYLIVGLFTLAVIASGFMFVWWFSQPAQRAQGRTIEVAYDGAVSGLRVGSSVLFNGIWVGEVRSLRLDPTDPRRVIAVATVQASAPIRADTKAGLEYQGLTGIASISLTGGQPDAPPPPSGPDGPPRIVAQSSSLQDMMSVVRTVGGQAEAVLTRIDRLLSDNQADVRAAVSNIARFSEALGRNSEAIDGFVKDASAAAKSIASVSAKVEQLVSGEDGKGVVAEISGAARAVRVLAENLDKRTAEVTTGVTRFTNQGLREFEAMATDGRRTINDFDRTLRNFERNPRQFIFGGGGVPEYSGRR
ncbi:MlaD family protein [Blastochloris sulfoviridis]|uniref:MCE family protein n=1 Tax=Blastochloris sulfoviridis TaxID=50712 RepID=A0A5M6HQI8_9HYPH|nr:MlaD family protein [Blastochloris sulfoviridis]KAA5598142.1 MCE family protein [Blastochloris sulfoviridis]